MNPLLRDFAETLATRYPIDGKNMSMGEWICENTSDPRHPGRKFSFKGREFQKAIADDMSQSMACIKPSQVGLTEVQVRKAGAFAVRNRGSSLIFSLPNQTMYKRVSKTRVKPLFQREKVFQSTMGEKPSQSMDLYEINGSFVYFTGMTEGDATSIPADFLLHDEVDLSDQQIIGLYQSRLQASLFKITQKFSTPTHPNFSIDAAYKVSDQMEYMIKCQCCGHHQIPQFNTKFVHLSGYDGDEDLTQIDADHLSRIDFTRSGIVCERCHRMLDILNPELREWVPRHPGRRSRGYRVRPFCTESLSLEYIVRQLVERRTLDDVKGWFNTCLGEPHSDGSNQLDEVTIKRVMKNAGRQEIGALVPVSVGIDVGKVYHLTMGPVTRGGVNPMHFEVGPIDQLPDRVREIMETQNVVAGGIDRYPYTPTAEEIRDISKGRILPVEYAQSGSIQLVQDELENVSHARVNRTAAIDRVVRTVQRRGMEISGYGAVGQDVVIAHMCDMVRIETEEVAAKWEKLTGGDHFMHSLVYLLLGPRMKELVLMRADPVMTQFGFVGVGGKVVQKEKQGTLFSSRVSNQNLL